MQNTINIDNSNVGYEEYSVQEIRDYLDGENDLIEELEALLDEAQGRVHSGQAKEAYVVIRVA